jgi:hypothetical protein
VSDTPSTWPPRHAARENIQLAARLLGGFELTVLGVLLALGLVSAPLSGDPARAPVFYLGDTLVTATAGGLAVGSLMVPWMLALALSVPLALGTFYAVYRLARHDPRPALVAATAWLLIATPLLIVGGAAVTTASQLPLMLGLLVFGTWPAARPHTNPGWSQTR